MQEDKLTYGVELEDGFNFVRYSFWVQPRTAASAVVHYSVDCQMRHQDVYQPSERLACMMAKQDGLLVKRLKSHIESSHPVQCF